MFPALTSLLVDPALFTAPYDAALTRGLMHAGVRVLWAGRPMRPGESDALDPALVAPIYYRGVQATVKGQGALLKARKVLSHFMGGRRLLRMAADQACDVVHFQWAVVPLFDGLLIRRLSRQRPVILTVHDLSPFNGSPSSRFQLLGFDQAMRSADRLIVHTATARAALIARGHAPERIVHIPHGPFELQAAPALVKPRPAGKRWRLVLFGKLQPYKGVDVLIEAMGRLAPTDRARLQLVVAGEALMPLEPLIERARALGLDDTVQFCPGRLTEAEMAELFAGADGFVFPYRHIEASGVLHLVLPFARWIVASDLGAFREMVVEGVNGCRVPAGAPDALAAALLASVGQVPDSTQQVSVTGWDEIGARTRAVYEEVLVARRRPI